MAVAGQAADDSEAAQAEGPADDPAADAVADDLVITPDGSYATSVWIILTISTTKRLTGSDGSLPTAIRSSRDERPACVPSISVACPPPSNVPDIWLWCPSARTMQTSALDTAGNGRVWNQEFGLRGIALCGRPDQTNLDCADQGGEGNIMKSSNAILDDFWGG